jgi:hypothetical protein
VTRRKLAAAVLAVAALAASAAALGACSGDDDGSGASSGSGRLPTTTVNTGGLDIDTPDGWLAIPVPDLGFGVAVPPGWEATLLSPEGLSTLAGASPEVPDFVDLAHAAATQGGLLYAAGVDGAGGVSDLVVRGAPQAGVTDVAGLTAYAQGLATAAGRPDQEITVVEDAPLPTVQMRFGVGGEGGAQAAATETLVAAPNDIVWDLTVTSDDAASHDELVRQIVETFTLQ